MDKRFGIIGSLIFMVALLVACAPAAAPTPTPTKAPAAATAAPKPAEATPTAAPAAKPTTAPAAQPTPAAKVPTTPIKFGYLTPLVGVFAGLGADLRDGWLLYFEEKGNTVAGRKVETITEDTEGKPDVGLTKAKKLVERDGVKLLAGIISSGVAPGVAKYATEQKVPLIITNAGADALTKQAGTPYVFRTSFSNSQNTHAVGEWAYKKGYRKAVIVGADYGAGWDHAGGFALTFTQAGGTIVQEIWPPLGTPDFAPFITTIKTDADVVFNFAPDADALRFVKQYTEFGLKGKLPLLGGWLTTENVLPQQGDAALGVINGYPFIPTMARTQAKAFVAAFEKRFNKPATPQAEFGYSGAMMAAKALEAIGGNIEDTAAFIAALEKAEVEAPRARIKLDKYHGVIHDVYIAEVRKVDGKLVNVEMEKVSDVSQFWKWSPEDYMKMPTTDFAAMKGKWVK